MPICGIVSNRIFFNQTVLGRVIKRLGNAIGVQKMFPKTGLSVTHLVCGVDLLRRTSRTMKYLLVCVLLRWFLIVFFTTEYILICLFLICRA